jgi:hypothetical protein
MPWVQAIAIKRMHTACAGDLQEGRGPAGEARGGVCAKEEDIARALRAGHGHRQVVRRGSTRSGGADAWRQDRAAGARGDGSSQTILPLHSCARAMTMTIIAPGLGSHECVPPGLT